SLGTLLCLCAHTGSGVPTWTHHALLIKLHYSYLNGTVLIILQNRPHLTMVLLSWQANTNNSDTTRDGIIAVTRCTTAKSNHSITEAAINEQTQTQPFCTESPPNSAVHFGEQLKCALGPLH